MPFKSIEEATKKHPGLKKYSEKAQRGWLKSINSCFAGGGDDGKCFPIAWSVANKVDSKKAMDERDFEEWLVDVEFRAGRFVVFKVDRFSRADDVYEVYPKGSKKKIAVIIFNNGRIKIMADAWTFTSENPLVGVKREIQNPKPIDAAKYLVKLYKLWEMYYTRRKISAELIKVAKILIGETTSGD